MTFSNDVVREQRKEIDRLRAWVDRLQFENDQLRSTLQPGCACAHLKAGDRCGVHGEIGVNAALIEKRNEEYKKLLEVLSENESLKEKLETYRNHNVALRKALEAWREHESMDCLSKNCGRGEVCADCKAIDVAREALDKMGVIT